MLLGVFMVVGCVFILCLGLGQQLVCFNSGNMDHIASTILTGLVLTLCCCEQVHGILARRLCKACSYLCGIEY